MINRVYIFVFFFLCLIGALYSSIFLVDQRQYAVIFGLGKINKVINEPGLHFKIPAPFENVKYFDKRILTIDTAESDRFITSEKLNVVVDTFVKWKIIDLPTFIRSVSGSKTVAVDRINRNLRDSLNNEIARRTVSEMVSGARNQVVENIRKKIGEDSLQIGVQIIDVRIKRVNFAPEVSERVFARMESERKQVANQRRATGYAESEKIRAEADREKEVILAKAYRDAQGLKGEGDAKAADLFARAYGENPEFAKFYRSLAAYENIYTNKDIILVNPNSGSDFFKVFKNPYSDFSGDTKQ